MYVLCALTQPNRPRKTRVIFVCNICLSFYSKCIKWHRTVMNSNVSGYYAECECWKKSHSNRLPHKLSDNLTKTKKQQQQQLTTSEMIKQCRAMYRNIESIPWNTQHRKTKNATFHNSEGKKMLNRHFVAGGQITNWMTIMTFAFLIHITIFALRGHWPCGLGSRMCNKFFLLFDSKCLCECVLYVHVCCHHPLVSDIIHIVKAFPSM